MTPDESKRRPSGQDSTDSLAHHDDAIIGKALRWSGGIVLMLSIVGTGAFMVFRKPKPAAATQVTTLQAPVAPPSAAPSLPKVHFTDITESAGLRFNRFNGAEGEKLLPESMGGGAAFFDFDNDGDPDLLLVNGTSWPWSKAPAPAKSTHALYRNDGSGRFQDVTAGSGLDVPSQGMGVACGDFDNDGKIDVFISNVGANQLFRNLGDGKFLDVTAPAGVGGSAEDWSTGAAFLDLDRDGDLDLFVANYVRWNRELDFQVGYSLDGKNRAYGPPMNFQGSFPYLYRNDGNGVFSDISESSGVRIRNSSTQVPAAKSLGIAPADINGDGWIDILVANDTVQNFAFTNRHNRTFAEVGFPIGVAFDSIGNARGAMGIDVARHRNDASLAVAIGNFANEMTALYVRAAGTDLFTDEAIAEGVGPASRLPLKFGVLFLDYDLDGWLDLLSANGHLDEDITKIQQSQHYRQSAQLFWNAGSTPAGGGFVEAKSDHVGSDLFKPIVGRGSATADIDADGDPDVLLLQAHGAPLLLRNDQKLGHTWIRLRLQGTRSNRDAIGAWVHVTAGGITQSRQVMPTRSYLSQSELTLSFGLGKNPTIDAIEIVWPDGRKQSAAGLQPGATHTVGESPP